MLSHFLKTFDSFGQTYSLNLKGYDTYNTRLGGFSSLVIYTLILAFTSTRCIQMATR